MQESRGFRDFQGGHNWRDRLGNLQELFGTAYAQWVVAASGDEQARAAWRAHCERYLEPWSWEDFAPIGRAFDAFFALKRLARTPLVPETRSRPSLLAEPVG